MKNKQTYRCIKEWSKNRVGDIVPQYLYNKYPSDIQAEHFEPTQSKRDKQKDIDRPVPVVDRPAPVVAK